MTVDLIGIASIYASLTDALSIDAPEGLLTDFPRKTSNDDGLLSVLSRYTDCTFSVFILDFSESVAEEDGLILRSNSEIVPFRSFILNFEDRAEIYLNSNLTEAEISGGTSNDWLRFLVVKEALHVLLRQEFIREDYGHPDTNFRPEDVLQHLEELIAVPFTEVDFENLEHTELLKIEHAAALLSCFLLYPLEDVLRDRSRLLDFHSAEESKQLSSNEILAISRKYLIPSQLVEWLIRWDRLDEFEALVSQEKLGFGR